MCRWPTSSAAYVLVKDNSSAGERRAVALGCAGQVGFEVTETYVDDTWRNDPVTCFALARGLRGATPT
ncbi:hypothetical protein [Streptomyces albogriseolus]|uniref:hypothetical protein n=1 Tax=Streptomyces TaxID=1883 RepID=UPI003CEDED69